MFRLRTHTGKKVDMNQSCANLYTQQLSYYFVKKKRYYSLLILLLFSWSSFGCSMEASLESLTEDIISPIFSKPTMAEVTPASRQNSYTSNRGFQAQASLGFQNVQGTVTTSRGYKVDTTVQGTIFKE